MIHGVFGKLGSGKGLLVMDIIAKELIDGFRDIVTNVPVRIIPWVNGQGIPQIGLKAYLLEKLKPLTEDEVDVILKRVLIIEDIDKGGDLFMWRRDGETGEHFKLTVTKVDDKGRPERFDASEIKSRNCAPILCITDEAWQFYPNNGGWARVPLLPFYARQQRKLRDEWYIVTQHPTDVDAVLWNIAQDFWVCRNHGMERMGIFRQPAMFRVIVYLTNPAKGGAIRSHEMYRVLDKKLSQCYDTTAGVGITGGFAGDSNQKRKGLHLGWGLAGVCLFVFLLAAVPHYIGKGAGAWFRGTKMPTRLTPYQTSPTNGQTASSKNEAIKTGLQSAFDQAGGRSGEQSSISNVDQLYCVGYAKRNGGYTVFLSDGQGVDTESGRVAFVGKYFVAVDGTQYKIKAAGNSPSPVSSVSASYDSDGHPVSVAQLGAWR